MRKTASNTIYTHMTTQRFSQQKSSKVPNKGSPNEGSPNEDSPNEGCPNEDSPYTPPSHEVLSGRLLSQEIANINLKIIQKLNYSKNLTIGMIPLTKVKVLPTRALLLL